MVPNAAAVPASDLQFLKDLVAYEAVNLQVSKVSTDKFGSHLWYLSEELVCLSLMTIHRIMRRLPLSVPFLTIDK